MFPIESLNLQMLNVGLARHDGDWNWQQVSSPFTRIFLVTEGEAHLHIPDMVVDLRPGYMYIIPPYTVHSYECKGVFCHYYLHFYEGFKNETNVFEMFDFPFEVATSDICRHIFEEMCHDYPDAKLPESNPQTYDNAASFTDYVRRYNSLLLWQKMRLRGSMLLLFSRFLQHSTPKVWTADERLAKVLEYANKHLYEDIDISNLANIACINKFYLIRLFKQEFGMSPMRYITKRRMERSQLLLLTSDKPVKEVAYAMGFNDHSYFIRQFKKIVGITPLEYRRTRR